MLLSKNILKNIFLHLKSLKFFGPFPLSLDKHTWVLSCNKKNGILKNNLANGFIFCLSIIIWIQLWQNRKFVPKVVTYEGMIPASSSLVFAICGYFYVKRSDAVAELFNLIVKFERNQLVDSKCKSHNLFFNCMLF